MMLGYARVSKGETQDTRLQETALRAAGVERLFTEQASGGRWAWKNFCLFGLWVALPYCLYANWVWGGGWLAQGGLNWGLGHGAVDFRRVGRGAYHGRRHRARGRHDYWAPYREV